MTRKKSALLTLGVAAAICAAPVVAGPAAATEQTPTGTTAFGEAVAPAPVNVTISARAKAYTDTETTTLAVHVYNNESAAVDVKITTPYGTQSFSKVQPGKAAYVELPTGLGTAPAGSVTVAAYVPATPDTSARYTARTVQYAEVVATQNPRGTANANAWVHPQDGTVYLSGYYVNKGAHAVTVRYKTPYGNSDAQVVQPGKAAYFTVDTHKASVPAGSAVIAAYKWIEGKGYYTDLPVATPALANAAPVVTITSPSVDDVVHRGFTVTGTATDDYALADDLVTLHLRPLKDNGKCGAFVATTTAPVGSDGAWSATFAAADLPAGQYCVTALTTDNAGTQNAGGGTHLKAITLVDDEVVEPAPEPEPTVDPEPEPTTDPTTDPTPGVDTGDQDGTDTDAPGTDTESGTSTGTVETPEPTDPETPGTEAPSAETPGTETTGTETTVEAPAAAAPREVLGVSVAAPTEQIVAAAVATPTLAATGATFPVYATLAGAGSLVLAGLGGVSVARRGRHRA
ncbi:hypothetical protein CLV28_0933 [Sediminihabitans luteus]|uniref:Gram-positive cocci surface proteins LPxTG domain-containing protein n=1 Tax=Sediminihabitans luteus TaxID=1138585 RepID=A0A2M9D0P3_9CELL|nr:hypothetical protein [Sediminihabitans luteus]PJJ77707.1 hypothetical protein CLV28_0933 [Sediminihabitans luteus]GIJ00066.1 hypothetical protein Slu03_24430 [Sediminihabitans luteus]